MNIYVIGALIVMIAILAIILTREQSTVVPVSINIDDAKPIASLIVDNGETKLDSEEFSMYDGALENWLEYNPPKKPRRILNVNSVNNPVEPDDDAIPYSETTRFQTPTHYKPIVNPSFNTHIRPDT